MMGKNAGAAEEAGQDHVASRASPELLDSRSFETMPTRERSSKTSHRSAKMVIENLAAPRDNIRA